MTEFMENQDPGSQTVTLPSPFDKDIQEGDTPIPIYCFVAGTFILLINAFIRLQLSRQ